MTPSRLDTQLPLKHLGIDSLTAMELRRKVELELGIVLPIVQLLDGPSVAGLADWLGDPLSGAARSDRGSRHARDAA